MEKQGAVDGLQAEVLRRGRYLTGIVEMQQRLLTTTSDSLGAMNHALGPLGEASQADRVYIFENERAGGAWTGTTSQVAEWCAPGVVPQIDNPDLQGVDVRGLAPRWHGELSAGRALIRNESEYDDFEVEYLGPQGIKTLVVFPLMVEGEWTGFIGFDNCRVESSWSDEEIALLRSAAAQIGLVMAERRARRELAALNAVLERRVAERTTELEDRNERLLDALERLQRVQQDLVQAEKLSGMGKMVAGVAHELRNPVNFVTHHIRSVSERGLRLQRGLAEMIDPDEPENEEVCTWLDEEFSAVARLTEEGMEGLRRVSVIVDSLVNFASVQRDEVASFSVREVVEDAIRILAPKWPMVSAVTTDRLLDHTVQGNRVKIAQVLLNLLDNALYAALQGREASEARVAVAAGITTGERPMTWIEVSDNGPGIETSVVDRIFDPFMTTKPVGKGTGMGLSVSWAIAKEHDGKLEIAATGPTGTVFRLSLPTDNALSRAT